MEIKKPIKSGVIIEPIVESDWIFGAGALDMEIKVDDGNWTPYLPSNEKQRQGFESFCCTNFSSTTAIEILMTRLIKEKKLSVGNLKWLQDNVYFDDNGIINFSDRYDAIVSGTTTNGNTLKAPAEAKRKMGLIPEKMLPWIDDKQAYFDKNSITQEMYALGQEFLKRFSINYEMVYEKDIKNALKVSPVAGACYAWNGTDNEGVFIKVNYSINHAICRIKPPTQQQLMDSYDPFIKTLANDYIFMSYGIRYIIRENIIEEPQINEKKNMAKTIKFQTEKQIYKVDNTNPKNLTWIGDWETYQYEIDRGWIEHFTEISDGLKPTYNIEFGMVNIKYKLIGKIISFLKSFGEFKVRR